MSDSIGLDFGTTNSAVATVTDSHAVLACYETTKGPTDTFPSILYFERLRDAQGAFVREHRVKKLPPLPAKLAVRPDTALQNQATRPLPIDSFVVIPGIGRAVKAHRKARMGRNPQTGEAIKIKAKTVVRLRPSKAFKDAVLK